MSEYKEIPIPNNNVFEDDNQCIQYLIFESIATLNNNLVKRFKSEEAFVEEENET